jgi:hypothetical protein
MDIKTIEVAKISLLIDIAARALDADFYEDAENAAQADLHEAYQTWKADHDIQHVARDTPEWEAMMAGTAEPYADYEKCKRQTRNAKKRLRTSVARYRGWLA